MGGVKYKTLNNIAENVWHWCENRDIWLFASYISSKANTEAEKNSRKQNVDTEYSLSPIVYKKITQTFGTPNVDLFASKQNSKCKNYFSWKRDPNSFGIAAFTVSWQNMLFYAFPPFAIIPRDLNKVILDEGTGLLVVPLWETQPWYPLFKRLLVSEPLIFTPNRNMLSSPFSTPHLLWRHLTLVAGKLSGKRFDAKDSLKQA